MSEDAPSDSWRSVIQSLSSLDATTTTKESIVDSGVFNPSWTRASLVAKRRTLKQRQEVLARALALQQAEVDRLDLWEKRVHNSLQPIGRLPVELLVMVFRYLRRVRTTVNGPISDLDPAILAAVCQRWMNIVMNASGPGAELWTDVIVACDTDDSFLSASRRLGVVLSRSRSLPFTLHLTSNAQSTENTLRERKRIAYEAALHFKRCSVLAVHNVPVFHPIFPLSGPFDSLTRLHLRFREGLAIPSLLRDATFPSVQTLEFSNLRAYARPVIGDNLRVAFPSCTELILHRFQVTLLAVIYLIGDLSSIVSLSLDGLFPDMTRDLQLLRPNNMSILLPDLQKFAAHDFQSRMLLEFIKAPRLEALHLARGSEKDGPEPPRLDVQAHPELRWLALEDVGRDEFQWAELVAERRAIRSLVVIPKIEVVQHIVGLLLKHAQGRPDLSAPVNQNEDLFTLFLDIRSTDADGQTESNVRELVSDLEALAAVRELRERLYGSHFRICLPDKLHPLAEEVVSRYPEFLGTFIPQAVDQSDWTSNGIF